MTAVVFSVSHQQTLEKIPLHNISDTWSCSDCTAVWIGRFCFYLFKNGRLDPRLFTYIYCIWFTYIIIDNSSWAACFSGLFPPLFLLGKHYETTMAITSINTTLAIQMILVCMMAFYSSIVDFMCEHFTYLLWKWVTGKVKDRKA